MSGKQMNGSRHGSGSGGHGHRHHENRKHEDPKLSADAEEAMKSIKQDAIYHKNRRLFVCAFPKGEKECMAKGTLTSMLSHLSSSHLRHQPFFCQNCGQDFATLSDAHGKNCEKKNPTDRRHNLVIRCPGNGITDCHRATNCYIREATKREYQDHEDNQGLIISQSHASGTPTYDEEPAEADNQGFQPAKSPFVEDTNGGYQRNRPSHGSGPGIVRSSNRDPRLMNSNSIHQPQTGVSMNFSHPPPYHQPPPSFTSGLNPIPFDRNNMPPNQFDPTVNQEPWRPQDYHRIPSTSNYQQVPTAPTRVDGAPDMGADRGRSRFSRSEQQRNGLSSLHQQASTQLIGSVQQPVRPPQPSQEQPAVEREELTLRPEVPTRARARSRSTVRYKGASRSPIRVAEHGEIIAAQYKKEQFKVENRSTARAFFPQSRGSLLIQSENVPIAPKNNRRMELLLRKGVTTASSSASSLTSSMQGGQRGYPGPSTSSSSRRSRSRSRSAQRSPSSSHSRQSQRDNAYRANRQDRDNFRDIPGRSRDNRSDQRSQNKHGYPYQK